MQTVKRRVPVAANAGPTAATSTASDVAAAAEDGDVGDDDRPPDSHGPGLPPLEARPELGRYQLLFELARGGMGTVHAARLRGAHGFDRLVAIKQLKAEGSAPEHLEAFLAEARITARLNHPNVVQTLELGEHEGRPFIVMELIRGVSLARLLRRIQRAGDQLPTAVAVWVVSRVAAGLHAAHERALIHRDVSPENILLSFEGGVYVADFGVAKLTETERQTVSGVVKGKFAYMSPEQTEARVLDRRSDVFALGIVLHEALTGARLFAADSMAATIRRIWALTPPDPRDGRDDVPEELVHVAMRCLEKAPEDRYDSADEVASALRRVLRAMGAMLDESDVSELIVRYFPNEQAALDQRIRDATLALDERGPAPPLDAHARPLEVSPAHRALSTGEQTHEGSVTASITTGPPLAPIASRGLTGALVAVALAAIAGGLWLSRQTAPQAQPEGTASPVAPVPPSSAASSPSPTDRAQGVAPSATASGALPGAAASAAATEEPPSAASSGSTSAAPAFRPPAEPLPPRAPRPSSSPAPPSPSPAPPPTRGKPIDIFDN